MTDFFLGEIHAVSAALRPDLLAAPVRDGLAALGAMDDVGVVEIDPALSDTAATREAYGLHASCLLNCVVVGGTRDGVQRTAACLVPASKRADVNGFVRRRIDVRRASFLPQDDAVTLTGMEFGGITPVGLPPTWPLLIDADAVTEPLVVIGSGVRRSKLVLSGALLARLPSAEVTGLLARAA